MCSLQPTPKLSFGIVNQCGWPRPHNFWWIRSCTYSPHFFRVFFRVKPIFSPELTRRHVVVIKQINLLHFLLLTELFLLQAKTLSSPPNSIMLLESEIFFSTRPNEHYLSLKEKKRKYEKIIQTKLPHSSKVSKIKSDPPPPRSQYF